MPPIGEPHRKEEKDLVARRALNTPENAQRAIETSRQRLASLLPGRVWRHRAPHGELEIKASLLLDDAAVVVLHFNPEDGSLMPKGLHAISEGRKEAVSLVESNLQKIPGKLIVLEGAEFREPESCWAVPLSYEGRIVAHLKVSSEGTKILPDRKASEEMDKVK